MKATYHARVDLPIIGSGQDKLAVILNYADRVSSMDLATDR